MVNFPESLAIICSYIRLVSYTTIMLTSFVLFRRGGILPKLLLIGDIIVAFGFFVGGLHVKVFGLERGFFDSIVLTPTVIIWAIFHFCAMIRKG